MLSSFPHLDKDGGPHCHDQRVQAIVRCVCIDGLTLLVLLRYKDTLIDEEDQSGDSRNKQPTCIEDLVSIEEGHLLSIVIRDVLQRLHLFLIVPSNEAEEEPQAMLPPGLVDLFPELIMQREML